jgi:hypothetical protein
MVESLNPKITSMNNNNSLIQTIRYAILIKTHINYNSFDFDKINILDVQVENKLILTINNTSSYFIKPKFTMEFFDKKGESLFTKNVFIHLYPNSKIIESLDLTEDISINEVSNIYIICDFENNIKVFNKEVNKK